MNSEIFTGSLAVIGGTGALGYGLATRAARANIPVYIGSRQAEKAMAAAGRLRAQFPNATIEGSDNRSAAKKADLVAVTVPFASQLEVLADIRDQVAGKVVIDTTVPLAPPRVARVQLPAEGSAALRAQQFLGDKVYLVSAFHNVAAAHLGSDAPLDCDVLVFGDHKESRETALRLIAALRLKGWHGGSLANSVAAEALTSVLIFINKAYGPGHAGVKITFSAEKGN